MSLHSLSRRAAVKTGAAAAVGLALGRSLPLGAQTAQTLKPITKPIPSTGEQLPVIGLGTNAYSVTTPEQMTPLRDVLERMPQLGGKLIDTARVYGRSEAVIGELVEGLGNRKPLFIATKTPIGGDFSNPRGGVRRVVQGAAHGAHRPDPDPQHGRPGGDDAGLREGEGGRTRALHRHEHVEGQAVRRHDGGDEDVSARLRPGGLFDRQPQRRRGDPHPRAGTEDGGAHQRAVRRTRHAAPPSTFARVSGKPLPDFAAEFDATTWAQVFLKYIVSHPAVTAAIPGTTQRRNLEDNQGAGRGRLPDAAMRRRIEQHWDTLS